MEFLLNTISFIARLLLRLVLLVVGAVFALVLVCVGLLGLLYVLLKALLTGRKPEFVTTFVHFRQASQQFNRVDLSKRQSPGNDFTSSGEVIDGQATEIRDDPALPQTPEK